jgi:hypothetical protein
LADDVADSITGVHRILPSYPIKPSAPADKDRDDDKQERQAPRDDADDRAADDGNDPDQPTIDEYV